MDDVKLSGPLFDGGAEASAREGVRAVRQQLAKDAERLAAAAFTAQIRAGHGEYQRHITTTGTDRVYATRGDSKTYTMPVVVSDLATDLLVTTDLATYGPYLEGTGSRNETTRFKGYHGFRLAAQALNRTAQAVADEALSPYVKEMNS